MKDRATKLFKKGLEYINQKIMTTVKSRKGLTYKAVHIIYKNNEDGDSVI